MLHWTGQLEAPRIDCHVSVAAGYRVYSFGGYCTYMIDTSMMIDVHVFNTVTLCWEKLPPVDDGREEVPSMRERHTAVLIGTIVYIWGGVTYTVNYCNMLYAFDVNTHRWSKPRVSGTIPEARYNHSACVLEKSMYIYGGYIQLTGLTTNGIHRLDTDTMAWTLINTGSTLAPVSLFHSATFIGTKMFVFGGHFVNNNISVFDTETNRWLSTRPAQLLPKGCRGHSAFAYNGELYVFGDCNTSGLLDLDQIFNYLWKFTPETFSWKKVEPIGKGPTWMTRVCCCMVGDRVVLLGRSTHNQLYILDLSPSLKTLCKLAVTQYRLDLSELPHDIRWELAAMATNRNRIKFGTEM